MLTKKHRLSKTSDVKGTLGRGRAFFNPLFTLKFARGGTHKRFTVIVSTKVSKKATTRNRIKRLIREYIRLNLPSFLSGDYAVIVKPALGKLENENWQVKLKDLFGPVMLK